MHRMIALAAAVAAMSAFGSGVGPSTTQSPYLIPVEEGVEFTSILSVGDSVKKRNSATETYRMAGIPDGLGAYDNGDGTFTVLMNHELRSTVGVVRAHGGKGAFVSRWQIRKKDLKVLNGEDLMKKVQLWVAASGSYAETAGVVFSRFCSADLAPASAFFDSDSDKGYSGGRLYLNGEEDEAFGRAVAHLSGGAGDGTSYELPRLGKKAWENVLASPFEQEKTVVVATEDGGLNRVYLYVGLKQETGTPVDQAGLNNGTTFEIRIPGYTTDDPATGFKSGTFEVVASDGTTLNRPEDGAWDPTDPRRFYFVTTASITGNTRLWLMTFTDIRQPELGGKIEVLVEGNLVPGAQAKMLDNMCTDSDGNAYLQEDVGNNVRLGRIWRYSPKWGQMTELALHDEDRFLAGAPHDIDGTSTRQSDEESSGIIEVTSIFNGVDGYDTNHFRYFLVDVQAHYPDVSGTALDSELVEGGQLLLMKAPRKDKKNKD